MDDKKTQGGIREGRGGSDGDQSVTGAPGHADPGRPIRASVEHADPERPQVRELFVVLTAGIGLLLSTLDTGIINVAIPTLVKVFHSTISGISWTVTLYTLVLTGSLVIFGRLGDRRGHRRIYAWGIVLFALSSILCGASQSVPELVSFRALQGLGAAMLQATSAAIITTAVPPERRGAALGTLGILMGLGPVLGPSVGGAVISLAGWRWIFLINIPFAAAALIGSGRLSRPLRTGRTAPLQLADNLLLSLAVLSLLGCLSAWPAGGGSKAGAAALFALFALLLAAFTLRELRAAAPILDLRLFRKGDFSMSMLSVFFFGGATSLGFIVPPYFLETVRGLAAWQSGLVNLSAPLGLVLLSKVSGNLMGKTGTRPLVLAGLAVMTAAYGVLGGMAADWPPVFLAALLWVYGVGAGIFVPANLSAIMGAVGRETQGTIGAVQRMVQNLGIAVGTAVAAALIRAHSGAGTAVLMTGFRETWGYAAATLAASLALSAAVKPYTGAPRTDTGPGT